MDGDEIVRLNKTHSLFSWSATGKVDPTPVVRAEGVYFWDASGKRWLDWNSQLMSVNIGHSHPRMIEAMKKAAEGLIFVHPGAATEVRARLGKRLAELVPGDIDTFFFTLGGAEANENALKAARQSSGRHKILTRYRSYHGATHGSMMMTGDPRRWASEPGASGFVKVMDPSPYTFDWGKTDEEITARHLTYLEEVIQYEGPHTIAAMAIETVTGTNGILIPPAGWLPGLRKLLDKYGILLMCDEVMCGFGRTGKMFAFEHGNIVPDILTMAKGLTSSYVPLGAMGVRPKIAEYFQQNVFYGGLTYNAHPFCLAVAEAALDILVSENMVENSRRMGEILTVELNKLQSKHPSIRTHRNIGLFGIVEIQKNSRGERIAGYNQSSPVMARLSKFFAEKGLYTPVRWDNFMCNPPLCITESELREGIAILDEGLKITDDAMES